MRINTLDSLVSDGGFVIEDIEIKGFMRYLDRSTISFPHKFTVITGRTGTGKTSILDAITFALYRRTSRIDLPNVKIESICQQGGYVKITFYQGSDRYEVTRGLTRSGSSYVTLRINGTSINGTIQEIDAKMQDIIGLDYVGFRNSTFVRQDEMRELGAQTGSQRLEIFQKLFRLETFEKAQTIAAGKLGKVLLDIRANESALGVMGEQHSRLPEKEEEYFLLKKESEDERERLNELKKTIEIMSGSLEELKSRHEEFLEARAKEAGLSSGLAELKMKIAKSHEDNLKTQELKRLVSRLAIETGDYELLQTELDVLKEKEQKVASIQKQKQIYESQRRQTDAEHKREFGELSARYNVQKSRLDKITTDIDKDMAFSLLKSEGALGERITRIDLELEWLKENEDLVIRLKREQEDTKCELDEVSLQTKKIDVDSFVHSEIQEGLKHIQNEMQRKREGYHEKIRVIGEELKGIQAEIDAIGFEIHDRTRLNEIQQSLNAKRQKKDELERIRSELDKVKDYDALIEDLTGQKTQKEFELKDLRDSLRRLQEYETQYRATESELRKLEEGQRELDGLIHGREGEMKQLTKEIEALQALGERIRELEDELKKLQETSEVLLLLKDKIFHKRGVVMYAVNQLLPQLARESSLNLSDMTDNRFSKVRLSPYEENNRYGIRIEVEGPDGSFHDVQEFSGGEKTQINASLRFAIAKELASMPQVGKSFGRMKTLFIDEGDLGSLDTELSRELFVKKLFDMGRFFDKVILITHLTDVAEKFPAKLRVDMTPEGKSRIGVLYDE
ncbi:MAG: SMC family ATPase [Methanosarcinales archaeon Met12]|nr:MAG: SMC family ATPase [Methanosarcinales archaeon Met12]